MAGREQLGEALQPRLRLMEVYCHAEPGWRGGRPLGGPAAFQREVVGAGTRIKVAKKERSLS